MSNAVWLGTPQSRAADENVLKDPYTSKIGGTAILFRQAEVPPNGESGGVTTASYFKCPKCRSIAHVSLLGQLYAPLEVYDRVLYILMCSSSSCLTTTSSPAAAADSSHGPSGSANPPNRKMTEEEKLLQMPTKTPFCFALRSQNFSEAYFHEQEAANERVRKARRDAEEAERNKASEGFLFDETDDWGDDAEPADKPAEPAPAPLPTTHTEDTAVVEEAVRQPSYPLAKVGTPAPTKGREYTKGLPLDLFEEPAEPQRKSMTVEEDAEDAVRRYGDGAALDTTCFETDTETLLEKYVRKYMEKMEQTPSQCVRWCPGGHPLRTETTPLHPPPCPRCGAPRRFEVQLTAPAVYFLTRGMTERQNEHAHFSNVIVFTCSKNCYDEIPYVEEYTVVEQEI